MLTQGVVEQVKKTENIHQLIEIANFSDVEQTNYDAYIVIPKKDRKRVLIDELTPSVNDATLTLTDYRLKNQEDVQLVSTLQIENIRLNGFEDRFGSDEYEVLHVHVNRLEPNKIIPIMLTYSSSDLKENLNSITTNMLARFGTNVTYTLSALSYRIPNFILRGKACELKTIPEQWLQEGLESTELNCNFENSISIYPGLNNSTMDGLDTYHSSTDDGTFTIEYEPEISYYDPNYGSKFFSFTLPTANDGSQFVAYKLNRNNNLGNVITSYGETVGNTSNYFSISGNMEQPWQDDSILITYYRAQLHVDDVSLQVGQSKSPIPSLMMNDEVEIMFEQPLDPNVATIDENGKVVAVANGTTTAKAYYMVPAVLKDPNAETSELYPRAIGFRAVRSLENVVSPRMLKVETTYTIHVGSPSIVVTPPTNQPNTPIQIEKHNIVPKTGVQEQRTYLFVFIFSLFGLLTVDILSKLKYHR